jgi:hypothetical protein
VNNTGTMILISKVRVMSEFCVEKVEADILGHVSYVNV